LAPAFLLVAIALGENQRRIGWRHDVSLDLHRQMGSNLGNFSPNADFPDLSPVGVVHSNEGTIGTGTLLSPTMVVTAAHVLRGSNSAAVPDASDWSFSLGSDYQEAQAVHAVSDIILHNGWTARLSYEHGIGDGDLLGVDLALVRLKEPVTSVTPARFNDDSLEAIGSRIILAGYGSLAKGDVGVTIIDNYERFAGENSLDRVVEIVNAPDVPSADRGGLLGMDFDEPKGFFNSLGPNVTSVDYLGSGSSSSTPLPYEATTAEGDSGGPAFMRIKGAWKVVGTVSYGTKESSYGDVTVYTRLASQPVWLRSYLERWAPARRTGYGEWLNLDWFGNFVDLAAGWIFHEKLGWVYVPDNAPDEFWAWQKGIGWWWTGLQFFPYVYCHEHSDWLYFSISVSSPETRYFYDYSKMAWARMED
tara:strand:- start:12 stop:1265 length:1254 start_codon:yes stop_codon:yes gene_type:complete